MIIATAGHVDHGKSTLVRLLTGIDPDRWVEERRRGLTIDLGFAFGELPGGATLAMVDVPGHERFAANMLAGAHAVDVTLLVVSAREGWMPQSEEHLMVTHHFGARAGVVAVTHSDVVSEDDLAAAVAAVRERLEGTFLAGAAILPLDGRPGRRLDALADELSRLLLDTPPPPDEGRPRLWVDRVFVLDGLGRVLTGTLSGGSVAVGDRLSVGGLSVGGAAVAQGGGAGADGSGHVHRVRSLHVNGAPADVAGPGTRVAVRLADAPRAGLRRGSALVRPGQWAAGRHLHVALTPLRGRPPMRSRRGYTLVMGTAQWPVELRRPGAPAPTASADSDGPTEFVRLHAAHPVGPVAPGDRVVVRDTATGAVAAGGVVLTVDDTVRRYPPAALAARLRAVQGGGPGGPGPAAALARVLVDEAGGALPVVDLCAMAGPPEPLVAAGTVAVVGDLAVDPQALATRESQLLAALDAAVAAPAASGGARPHEPLGRAAVASLVADGQVEEADGRLWSAGSGESQRRREEVSERVLAAVAGAPRDRHELAFAAGVPGRVVSDLVGAGALVDLGDGLVAGAGDLCRWHAAVRRRLDAGPSTLAELRDALGLSRRLALAVLELSDAAGLSERRAGVRVRGPAVRPDRDDC